MSKSWSPSSINEWFSETFPGYSDQVVLKKAFNTYSDSIPYPFKPFFLIAIVLCVIAGNFFNLLYQSPVLWLQTIATILSPNIINISGVIVAMFLTYCFNMATECLCGYITSNAVYKFLIELKTSFYLKEYSVEDYITPEKISLIKTSRIFSMDKHNAFPIARIFKVCPRKKGNFLGQMKAFVIPPHLISSTSPPFSLIFLSNGPKNLSYCECFHLYHEIGHTTDMSWQTKREKFNAVARTIFIWGWFMVCGSGKFSFLWFLGPYTILQVFHEISPSRNEYNDEKIADSFAIKKYPDEKSLTRLENVLKRTILGPVRGQIDFKKRLLTAWRSQRFADIQYLIHLRKNNLSFELFHISHKDPYLRLFVGISILPLVLFISNLSWPILFNGFGGGVIIFIIAIFYLWKIQRIISSRINSLLLELKQIPNKN